VADHRLFVANGQFPRFTRSPPFGPRVADVARKIRDSNADCAALTELGYNECAALAARPEMDGWQYDRAQGRGRNVVGEGLTSVWSKTAVFHQPEARLHDWNETSFGQWQRTFLLARLEETKDRTAFVSVGAFHFAAEGSPLDRAGANRAKLAQVKETIRLVGDRRVLLAGDFPRTDAADDEALFVNAGYTLHGRDPKTPMCAVSRGAVRVTRTTRKPHGAAFDHDYQLIDFTLTGALP
jgi:hypothetical protein